MTARPGWVHLVGAGPGDPGLITRRGLDLLRSCDVVVYDRLVAPALIDEAPEGAERIYVGKSSGEYTRPQSEIDALLAKIATANKAVVRLKGGDPYVLGRGADEAQALAAAGIPFEVVPGITAAVAVPAYAGIPVTYGGTASSVVILTAHEAAQRSDSGIPWAELARGPDTLVLLMGVRTLDGTVKKLIEGGRDPDQPAAVIEWGTTARQRTVVTTLAELATDARASKIEPPATVVIGEVVRLRDALNWFEARPLFGKRIVITRPRHQTEALAAELVAAGAEVVSLPVIAIAPPSSYEPIDQAIKKLAAGLYSWVLFTSANATTVFFDRLAVADLDARSFGRARVAAVGQATATRLSERGIHADLVPEEFSGRALAEALGHGSGHILIPRAENAPPEILDLLQRSGWSPEEVPAYRTVAAQPEPARVKLVRSGAFDALVFASGSSVRNFVEIVGAPDSLGVGDPAASDRLVCCIGPQTAAAATEHGFRVDVVADDHTVEGLVAALVQSYAKAP